MRSALLRMGIANLSGCCLLIAALAAPPAYAQEKAPSAAKAAAKKGDSAKGESRGILPPHYRNVVDEKQRAAIYKVQEEYKAKIAPLQTQLESLTKERDAKIAALLTPEQRQKLEQLQAEAKAKRDQKPAAKTPPQAAGAPKAPSPSPAK